MMLMIYDYFKVINELEMKIPTTITSPQELDYLYMGVRCMPNLTNKGEASDDNFYLPK